MTEPDEIFIRKFLEKGYGCAYRTNIVPWLRTLSDEELDAKIAQMLYIGDIRNDKYMKLYEQLVALANTWYLKTPNSWELTHADSKFAKHVLGHMSAEDYWLARRAQR